MKDLKPTLGKLTKEIMFHTKKRRQENRHYVSAFSNGNPNVKYLFYWLHAL